MNTVFYVKHQIAKCATLALFLIPSFSWADSLQQTILTVHNTLRAKHHAPKLVWDDELARYAKRHLDRCEFKHSYGPYGENLACGFPSASTAVTMWYGENKDYSYFWPGFSKRTGHFTQLVWKSSRKIGCAYASCEGKNGILHNYLVCEYSPAGNLLSRQYFQANVIYPS